MKQARAFGVGLLLATQNPMDLDYRVLSNAEIWCIGRLQTDADRNRVVDALASSGRSRRAPLRPTPERRVAHWKSAESAR
jgi:DNA helicase HerA-like ATPase